MTGTVAAVTSERSSVQRGAGRGLRQVGMFVVAIFAVGCLWELYKLVGPDTGGKLGSWSILPRANDTAMPHTWSMVGALFAAEGSAQGKQTWETIVPAVWFSLRLALTAFVLGSSIGIGLGVVMNRLRVVQRGLLPLLVASQTVPLIALTPLVSAWAGKVQIGGWTWPRWMSVVVLGAFLAFFPVAVGTLKGLNSPKPEALELMRSFAASWRQTLFELRFPAAVPFMVPALKLAASASVFGVVVSEISAGLKGGVGRLILQFLNEAGTKPARLYTAVFGVVVLGLVMSGLVAMIDSRLMRNRPKEGLA
jgi:NitT/TauT family transport system permease protein